MITKLLIVCLLSTIAVHTEAQFHGQACRTPDNQNGICVLLVNCPRLSRIVSQGVLFELDKIYVKKHRCGTEGNFVCCAGADFQQTIVTTSPPTTTSMATTITSRATITASRATITASRATTTRSRTTTTPPTSRPTSILERRSIPTTSTTTELSLASSISARKCKVYEDFAYNKSYTISVFGPDIVHRTSNCAFTSTGLIIDGKVAILREFPHMALIGYISHNKIVWHCGGTLISERFVLSAEHCSWNEEIVPHGPPKYIRLGEHNINQTDEGIHMDFDIIQIISRPNVSPRTFNDIVLFKLDRDVPFSHAIRPACLPQQSDVPRVVKATGWGIVERGASAMSNVLLKVDLTTFSRDEWNRTLMAGFGRDFDEDTIIFAGHHSDKKDTCGGDSGGPLQIIDRNHHCTYIVVGVTSRGIGCGHAGRPAIYTKVYSHLDWIEQTVWPNQ